MPKNVEIEVFLIAKTEVDYSDLTNWLLALGVSDTTIYKLTHTDNTPAELVTSVAAKQCYMSFEAGLNPNVTKTRSDMAAYLENILASGHGSVLEHVNFTFAINNVSRVFTGEMNRHRAGVAVSERSMRYIRFQDCIDWWLPLSLRENKLDNHDLSARKALSRTVFERAFEQMEDNYQNLCNIWDMEDTDHNFHYKKTMTSCFRRIIGMGAATGGVWSFNIRALRHVLTMRCSKAAEEEIQYVSQYILRLMQNSEPKLFGDFDYDAKPKYPKV